MENANEILFRSSGNGHLMTEPRSKSEILSETTKTNLIGVFVSENYNRCEEITSKYLDKGNECEEDGITLLSRVNKVFYKKNETHLSNEFIKGTPDLFIGKSIEKAVKIIDTKLSYSAHTFFRTQKDDLNKMYFWQMQSYMWLTGAKVATVAFCLVNGTFDAIEDEKKRLAWRMKLIDPTTSDEYNEKCKQIEINHIFDLELFQKHHPHFEFANDISQWKWDIPKEKRVFEFDVIRDDSKIIALQKRVQECRYWMNENLYK